jgi:hypothetical protein
MKNLKALIQGSSEKNIATLSDILVKELRYAEEEANIEIVRQEKKDFVIKFRVHPRLNRRIRIFVGGHEQTELSVWDFTEEEIVLSMLPGVGLRMFEATLYAVVRSMLKEKHNRVMATKKSIFEEARDLAREAKKRVTIKVIYKKGKYYILLKHGRKRAEFSGSTKEGIMVFARDFMPSM